MQVIKNQQGVYYEAAKHYNNWGVSKLSEVDGSKNLSISVSEFLPNGGAEMSAFHKDRVYYILRGTMDIIDENDTVYSLEEGDMIYIKAGEMREQKTTGNISCRVLVMMASVD